MTDLLTLTLPDEAIDAIAERVAERLAERPPANAADGYMRPEAAAAYIGASSAKRIYDLKALGEVEPDGHDGRIPLYRRESLDAYATGRRRHLRAA